MARKQNKSDKNRQKNDSIVNTNKGGKVIKGQSNRTPKKKNANTNIKCPKCSKVMYNFNKNNVGLCRPCLKLEASTSGKANTTISQVKPQPVASKAKDLTKKSNKVSNLGSQNSSPKSNPKHSPRRSTVSTRCLTSPIENKAQANPVNKRKLTVREQNKNKNPTKNVKVQVSPNSKKSNKKEVSESTIKGDTMSLRGRKRSYSQLVDGKKTTDENQAKKLKSAQTSKETKLRESRNKKPTVKGSEWLNTIHSKKVTNTKQGNLKIETVKSSLKNKSSLLKTRSLDNGKKNGSPKVSHAKTSPTKNTAKKSLNRKPNEPVKQISKRKNRSISKEKQVQKSPPVKAKRQKVTQNEIPSSNKVSQTPRSRAIAKRHSTKNEGNKPMDSKGKTHPASKQNNLSKSIKKKFNSFTSKNKSSNLGLKENVLIAQEILHDILNSVVTSSNCSQATCDNLSKSENNSVHDSVSLEVLPVEEIKESIIDEGIFGTNDYVNTQNNGNNKEPDLTITKESKEESTCDMHFKPTENGPTISLNASKSDIPEVIAIINDKNKKGSQLCNVESISIGFVHNKSEISASIEIPDVKASDITNQVNVLGTKSTKVDLNNSSKEILVESPQRLLVNSSKMLSVTREFVVGFHKQNFDNENHVVDEEHNQHIENTCEEESSITPGPEFHDDIQITKIIKGYNESDLLSEDTTLINDSQNQSNDESNSNIVVTSPDKIFTDENLEEKITITKSGDFRNVSNLNKKDNELKHEKKLTASKIDASVTCDQNNLHTVGTSSESSVAEEITANTSSGDSCNISLANSENCKLNLEKNFTVSQIRARATFEENSSCTVNPFPDRNDNKEKLEEQNINMSSERSTITSVDIDSLLKVTTIETGISQENLKTVDCSTKYLGNITADNTNNLMDITKDAIPDLKNNEIVNVTDLKDGIKNKENNTLLESNASSTNAIDSNQTNESGMYDKEETPENIASSQECPIVKEETEFVKENLPRTSITVDESNNGHDKLEEGIIDSEDSQKGNVHKEKSVVEDSVYKKEPSEEINNTQDFVEYPGTLKCEQGLKEESESNKTGKLQQNIIHQKRVTVNKELNGPNEKSRDFLKENQDEKVTCDNVANDSMLVDNIEKVQFLAPPTNSKTMREPEVLIIAKQNPFNSSNESINDFVEDVSKVELVDISKEHTSSAVDDLAKESNVNENDQLSGLCKSGTPSQCNFSFNKKNEILDNNTFKVKAILDYTNGLESNQRNDQGKEIKNNRNLSIKTKGLEKEENDTVMMQCNEDSNSGLQNDASLKPGLCIFDSENSSASKIVSQDQNNTSKLSNGHNKHAPNSSTDIQEKTEVKITSSQPETNPQAEEQIIIEDSSVKPDNAPSSSTETQENTDIKITSSQSKPTPQAEEKIIIKDSSVKAGNALNASIDTQEKTEIRITSSQPETTPQAEEQIIIEDSSVKPDNAPSSSTETQENTDIKITSSQPNPTPQAEEKIIIKDSSVKAGNAPNAGIETQEKTEIRITSLPIKPTPQVEEIIIIKDSSVKPNNASTDKQEKTKIEITSSQPKPTPQVEEKIIIEESSVYTDNDPNSNTDTQRKTEIKITSSQPEPTPHIEEKIIIKESSVKTDNDPNYNTDTQRKTEIKITSSQPEPKPHVEEKIIIKESSVKTDNDPNSSTDTQETTEIKITSSQPEPTPQVEEKTIIEDSSLKTDNDLISSTDTQEKAELRITSSQPELTPQVEEEIKTEDSSLKNDNAPNYVTEIPEKTEIMITSSQPEPTPKVEEKIIIDDSSVKTDNDSDLQTGVGCKHSENQIDSVICCKVSSLEDVSGETSSPVDDVPFVKIVDDSNFTIDVKNEYDNANQALPESIDSKKPESGSDCGKEKDFDNKTDYIQNNYSEITKSLLKNEELVVINESSMNCENVDFIIDSTNNANLIQSSLSVNQEKNIVENQAVIDIGTNETKDQFSLKLEDMVEEPINVDDTDGESMLCNSETRSSSNIMSVDKENVAMELDAEDSVDENPCPTYESNVGDEMNMEIS